MDEPVRFALVATVKTSPRLGSAVTNAIQRDLSRNPNPGFQDRELAVARLRRRLTEYQVKPNVTATIWAGES